MPVDVLVVDDLPANLQLLATLLGDHGYAVRPVVNGKAALLAAQRKVPDMVLLDIEMPEMNGFEVCRRFKAIPELSRVPVLFLSAFDDQESKLRAFAEGGVDYVTKPFQAPEILARIETHVRLATLAREANEDLAEIRRLEDMRDRLIHMIVHDMRSPMTGLLYSLEMIEAEAGPMLSSENLADLEAAQSAGRRVVTMVNDLLDVSRMEHHELVLQYSKVSSSALVSRGRAALPGLERQRRILVGDLVTEVECDLGLMERVVANLIANADKYSPASATIEIDEERTDDALLLHVRDRGSGVPAEAKEKIFELFGQVELRESAKLPSTGIGLAFCKLAMECHGGRIDVTDREGGGSTFTLRIPLQRVTPSLGARTGAAAAAPYSSRRAQSGRDRP